MQHPPANPERRLGIVILPYPGAHPKIRLARSSTLGKDRSRLSLTTFAVGLDGTGTTVLHANRLSCPVLGRAGAVTITKDSWELDELVVGRVA